MRRRRWSSLHRRYNSCGFSNSFRLPAVRGRPGGAGGEEVADCPVQGVAVELDEQTAQGVGVRDGHGAGERVGGETENPAGPRGDPIPVIAVSERAPARTLAAAAATRADNR
ncbi:hypothetical protein [Streptomyces ossamyceticus]|uniref:Uncharacterized protein n=1 Tax=Streptomyces ossamyceticus TaxID=249581 RepID=A0ABV2V731_9ACTN